MDVEAISPFDILIPTGGLDQVLIGHDPHEGGHKYPDSDAVDEYHIEEKLNEGPRPDTQHEGEPDRRDEEPGGQQHEEGRIVTCELKFGLLTIQKVPVNLKDNKLD